jgi:hypothetical protein
MPSYLRKMMKAKKITKKSKIINLSKVAGSLAKIGKKAANTA